MLKLLLLLGMLRLALSICSDFPTTGQPPLDYAASEIRLRKVLQRSGLDPLAMPQTPCQRTVDGFEGVLEAFCLQYTRGSEVNPGLWSEYTLTVPTDYCLLVHVCLGCPSDGNCTAEHNSFVVLTPMAGTDGSGEAGDPRGPWGELGGRVAVELCTQRCSSALFAMPSNRLHVAFIPESVPPVRSFHALYSYVKVRYLAVPSTRADTDAGNKYVQEWLEAGCDNGASGKFPGMLANERADLNDPVISGRSATGPVLQRAERIVHLGGGYPVFRMVVDADMDGRHLLGELVHSYLQHWLPSPLRQRLRTRSLRVSYSRRQGQRLPTPGGHAGREATPRPRRLCAPQKALPQMAVPLENCQFELQGKSGRFYSPNFPDSYPELVWCSWRLQAKETQSIVIKICSFTGGNECCLHSDRLIFDETPRRSIVAMVLSCWGHDTYYYTPKGSGVRVLLVSGDRQAHKAGLPRRFWGEYFILDEWDILDLSRLDCGDPGGNSILMNVFQQPASIEHGDRMVLANSEFSDLVIQVPSNINSSMNEWDLKVNRDHGTEADIQQGVLYKDARQFSLNLATGVHGELGLKIEYDESSVSLGSNIKNHTSAELAEKNAAYISDVELLKRMTALPVFKNQAHLSKSATVIELSINIHQTHVELLSSKTLGVHWTTAEAVNGTPVSATKTHNTPGFSKPMFQSQFLSPLNINKQLPSSIITEIRFKSANASVFTINQISPTKVAMVTDSLYSNTFIHYIPNMLSDNVLDDYVVSSTKDYVRPAFEIEPSYVQSKVVSQHFAQLSKAATLILPGSSTQTFRTDGRRVSVNRYPSSRTSVQSESGGKAHVLENLLQSSTYIPLLGKISKPIKGAKHLVSGKKSTKASAITSWLKSPPLTMYPVEASLHELPHAVKYIASLKTIAVARKHKGIYLQASRTRWNSLLRKGTRNMLTKPATAQNNVATKTTIINSTPVTAPSRADRTTSEASVDLNSWSTPPEAASLSQSIYGTEFLHSNISVSSPSLVFKNMTEEAEGKLAAGVDSVGMSPSTVIAHRTSSSDGPFSTLKTKVISQSLDIGTGPFKPKEYTWFKMSVESILHKKGREGVDFGRIVRLISMHLSQLMEKNMNSYYGSKFLSVVARQARWVAQSLKMQTELHVLFLAHANARLLQHTLSNLVSRNVVNRYFESTDGALRLQLLSINVTDVDECEVDEHLCDPNAFCHNTVGSYVCFCRENYINLDPVWKGTQCQSTLSKEVPEVAAPVSLLAVALVSATCALVLLLLVGMAVYHVVMRRRRFRLEPNDMSCTRSPAIYMHHR